jgi:DNA-binding CsgD family transcriptional regulator
MLAAAEAGQVEACGAVLGDELFETMWAEGAAMTWDHALAYALRGWGPRDRPAYGWDALTPTERQVADLVASGATNRETAEKLFMSVATVKTHLTRIYSKLGITSRVGLANVKR